MTHTELTTLTDIRTQLDKFTRIIERMDQEISALATLRATANDTLRQLVDHVLKLGV